VPYLVLAGVAMVSAAVLARTRRAARV